MEIGQKVFVVDMRGSLLQIASIEGETKTSWRVDGKLYKKGSLCLRGADVWGSDSIKIATEEMIKKFRHDHLVRQVKNIDLEKLSADQLQQILRIDRVGPKS